MNGHPEHGRLLCIYQPVGDRMKAVFPPGISTLFSFSRSDWPELTR